MTGQARDQLNQSALWLGLGATALSIGSIAGFTTASIRTIWGLTKNLSATIVTGLTSAIWGSPDVAGLALTSWGMAAPDQPPPNFLNWTLMLVGVASMLGGVVTAGMAVNKKLFQTPVSYFDYLDSSGKSHKVPNLTDDSQMPNSTNKITVRQVREYMDLFKDGCCTHNAFLAAALYSNFDNRMLNAYMRIITMYQGKPDNKSYYTLSHQGVMNIMHEYFIIEENREFLGKRLLPNVKNIPNGDYFVGTPDHIMYFKKSNDLTFHTEWSPMMTKERYYRKVNFSAIVDHKDNIEYLYKISMSK